MGQIALLDVIAYGLLAALATGLGGLLPILLWRPGPHFLAISLGLAGGAMLAVTVLGLIPTALGQMPLGTMVGLVVGLLTFAILDEGLSHRREKGSADSSVLETLPASEGSAALAATAVLVAVGIPLHGIAEGLAVGTGVSAFPKLGLVIAAALIIHKLPEGIAIATPLVSLGRARWQILRITLVRGFALLAGALLGLLIAAASRFVLSASLGLAAGAMLYISIDEMLHDAYQYGHPQLARWGMVVGVAFMSPLVLLAA